MAYEVTATRRRPQNFESLVGQEFVAETLKNSIQSGKIAHAYLFTGPRGCGKTSTARILAKALNCKNGPTATPCGQCEACREITAGSSLDVIEIDGATNNGVESARQIKSEVIFPPQNSRYKIYIIDEVHMITTEAFNALLKTIEEPPPYAIFIFATTELQKVPATIKSRCQQFNFRLVPIDKVKEQLSLAAKEIGIKAEDEALYWIAHESTGSMRDSYTLFDQVAAFSDGEITWEKIRDKLGLLGVDRLNELFGLCVKGDKENALLKLDDYLQNGVSVEQLIINCTSYLRSVLLIKSGIKKEALLGQSAARYNADVLELWNNTQVERALSIFMQLYRDIRYSLNPRYEFELAVSRLCWLREYVSASEVKKALDAVRPLLSRAAPARVIQNSSQGTSLSAPTEQKDSPSAEPVRERRPMPQFAALGEDKGSDHPFPDGGAEPPVNKSADSEIISHEEGSFFPDDSGFPDEYGSEPVEDEEETDYAAEQFASSISAFREKTQRQEVKPEPVTASLSDMDDVPEASESCNLDDMNQLASVMVQDFSDNNDPSLASTLSKAHEWTVEGNLVKCNAETNFDRIQLQGQSRRISAYLSKVFGRSMSFMPLFIEKKKEVVVKEYPLEVQILRDLFRGTVIGG